MMRNIDKENLLLGMSQGSAENRLRKMIMFSMMRDLQKDICFRCGEKINNLDDFSIDHKKDWINSDNPKEIFFDLNNITFSHLKCNTSKRMNIIKEQTKIETIKKKRNRKNKPIIHGTSAGYKKGCRCMDCKKGKAAYNQIYRKRNGL